MVLKSSHISHVATEWATVAPKGAFGSQIEDQNSHKMLGKRKCVEVDKI